MSIRTRLLALIDAPKRLRIVTKERDALLALTRLYSAEGAEARAELATADEQVRAWNNLCGECHETLTKAGVPTTALGLVNRIEVLAAMVPTPTPKPTRPVPEARRMAVLRAVAHLAPVMFGPGPSAAALGRYIYGNDDAFDGIGSETIAENARRLITEGYLSSNGKQGGPLALTEKGRAALGVELVGVAS